MYDFLKFLKYSASVKGDYTNKETLISSITMDYHRIEKGLSLPYTKLKFGLWFIPDLINRIIYFYENYGQHEAIISATNALNGYRAFHSNQNIYLKELENDFCRIDSLGIESNGDGIIHINSTLNNENTFSFKDFVESRHSIRDFAEGEIANELIDEAVKMAIKTPSVCNRQPWRVYSVKGDQILKLLEQQNGNLGFRNSISNLLIVTGKLSYMRGPIERHQIYIDGGLFSMSLIYALHSLDIGVCSLNWCVNVKQDIKARKIIALPNDEEIMMYLAIGNKKTSYKVAASPRLPLNVILKHKN